MNNDLNNAFFYNPYKAFNKHNKSNKFVKRYLPKFIHTLPLIFAIILGYIVFILLKSIIVNFNSKPSFYTKFWGTIVYSLTNIQMEELLIVIIFPLILLLINIYLKQNFKVLFWITNICSNCLLLFISIVWWFLSNNHQLEDLLYYIQQNAYTLDNYGFAARSYYFWPILSLMLIFSMIVYFLFKAFQLKNKQYINKPIQIINTICEFILFCGIALITFNSARWYIYLICITLSLIGFYKQVIETNQLNTEKSAKKKQV